MKTLACFLLAASVSLLPGCATEGGGVMSSSMVAPSSGAGTGSYAYAPALPPSARMPAGLPPLLLGQVVDDSNGGEFHGPMGYRLDVPWSDIVRDALSTELGRVGWATTRSKDLSGATLKARVTKVSATWTTGFFVKVAGEMHISLILSDPSGRDVWEGEIVGNGVGVAGGGGIPGNGIKQAVRAAFNDAIPKLGGVLEQERPWEKIGKARPAAVAQYAAPAMNPPAAIAAAPAPLLAPSFSAPQGEDDFAVVIGIENYPDLPAATYAERDATATQKFILALGVPERNIVLLTGNRATKTGMEKTIEAWLPNNVSEKSRVYVYYSGHGAPDTKTGDAYLVPSDGDPQYLAQTGYPLKRLYAKLGQLKAKSVLVALDSCFSGAGGRSVLAKGTRPLVGKVDMAVQSEVKISVIAASAGDQISGANDEAGYGLFTYNLLQGLNGAAKDAQGRVTLNSLYSYLKPRVQDEARRGNRDQTPQLQNGGSGDLVLRSR